MNAGQPAARFGQSVNADQNPEDVYDLGGAVVSRPWKADVPRRISAGTGASPTISLHDEPQILLLFFVGMCSL